MNINIFIVYKYFLWTGDYKFLKEIWPSTKLAIQWQMNR